ncbi:competence/damage-inducible protein A [Gracilibacillus salitolerans]|uniref:Putative competence-damage inducible protein n=1 Tax=Gracilibacillus salitolerans TaxID=2663022 RepID=A0A5Q2TI91_9BACI|nr:competence/damage-inducible protein A [Gracilibacillus salitolerans]QGH34599.1 competence/damage-inducible protein A [Gracilibacillus salitolerans]
MTDVKAELISVGTELLLGQIVNTNAAWISEQLADKGISVYYHSVVGDNFNRLADVFREAGKRSDLVFITGGLGPTEDDLTREAFQHISGVQIEADQGTLDKMEAFFAKNNRTMTPNNRKQAQVFEGSKVLHNSVGIAPGIIVDYNKTIWVFMPGVPREMKAIMTEEVLPYLKDTLALEAVIKSRMLRFIGIGESQLEYNLRDLISNQTNPTIAPLASEGEVALRLTAKAESYQEAEQLIEQTEVKIKKQVGQYLYAYDNVHIEKKVFELLKQNHLTIASAESLTGGAFASKVVDQGGVSAIFNGAAVVYHPFSKTSALRIDDELITTYGTISKECAESMARQVKKIYQSKLGISFTGVAGPDELENQPVGTVYISICDQNDQLFTERYQFNGDRQEIRNRAVKKAFELLFYLLKK